MLFTITIIASLTYIAWLFMGDEDTVEDFSCGSDEVCYCDKAKDCIKKK